ncbi:MAG: hypothetical protein ACRDQU_13035 [Pseudonocardiaceae bacterium]
MLHDLPRTLTVGGYTFPTRADYLASCANGRGLAELGADLLIAIQRDWHIRGQNGCVFAMHAARKLSAQQWRYEAHPPDPDIHAIRRSISTAISDPDNQILSLIFPAVECRAGLRQLIDIARSVGCYQAGEVDERSGLVSLRYPVASAEAWIVGFAPLATLPPTRQAPFAELAIRTKVKTHALHPALNGDASQAHLADVDLSLTPTVTARLIAKSIARTSKMLGGDFARSVARGAKAKVTFDLSAE